ncbi:MAG: glycosyltransferase family 4 protein [Balneola sp.]
MHILMLLDHNYPKDQRVENEVNSLVKAGFEVTVLSIGADVRSAIDFHDGARVVRIKMPAWLRKKLRGAVGFMNIYSHILAHYAVKLFRKFPYDAVHVHDLYLGKAGILIKKKMNIPLAIDLHENYVQALTQYAWSTRFPGSVLISIKKWEKLEREWLKNADLIITVIQEMNKRYLDEGFSKDKLVVTPNTPNIDSFRSFPIKEDVISKFEGKKVILYSGGFDLHRGLSTAVDSMKFVKEKCPDCLLVLVGDGRNRQELEVQVKENQLSKFVQFEGWQDQENIRSYVNRADIGIIPHVRSVQTDASIPHKLGYYMSEELPVITSNCTSLERMLTENDAGRVFESGNAEDLAEQILYLLTNKEAAVKYGINGKKAVEKDFNWNSTIKPFIEFYKKLESS